MTSKHSIEIAEIGINSKNLKKANNALNDLLLGIVVTMMLLIIGCGCLFVAEGSGLLVSNGDGTYMVTNDTPLFDSIKRMGDILSNKEDKQLPLPYGGTIYFNSDKLVQQVQLVNQTADELSYQLIDSNGKTVFFSRWIKPNEVCEEVTLQYHVRYTNEMVMIVYSRSYGITNEIARTAYTVVGR